MDLMRKEVEQIDYLGGMLMLHATGGGTGSGFASLIESQSSIEFKKNFIHYTVQPSPNQSPSIAEIYNAPWAMY